MKDPTGDLPWEEDDTAKDVMHISDPNVSLYYTIFRFRSNLTRSLS